MMGIILRLMERGLEFLRLEREIQTLLNLNVTNVRRWVINLILVPKMKMDKIKKGTIEGTIIGGKRGDLTMIMTVIGEEEKVILEIGVEMGGVMRVGITIRGIAVREESRRIGILATEIVMIEVITKRGKITGKIMMMIGMGETIGIHPKTIREILKINLIIGIVLHFLTHPKNHLGQNQNLKNL